MCKVEEQSVTCLLVLLYSPHMQAIGLCIFLDTSLILFLQRTSLAELLFIADNLAYFPYQVLDEPLFIIHHIDIMISVTGANLLQSFKEVRGSRCNPQTHCVLKWCYDKLIDTLFTSRRCLIVPCT